MPETLAALCWCERTEVRIPVQWVSEALTQSCGPNCGPGCPSRASVASPDDDEYSASTEVARNGKKTKMKRFNPAKYDPREDSSFGYANGGPRTEHPNGVILEVVNTDIAPLRPCPCGCGEAPRTKGGVFGMGHDARLRGKLARALAANCPVVLADADHVVVEVTTPEAYAARFSTDKLDWAVAIKESAGRAKRTAGDAAEREVLARALGPQVGDKKLIKVGRWEKTGSVVAVYDDGGVVEYEYVDGSGATRRARQDADGKVREIKAS